MHLFENCCPQLMLAAGVAFLIPGVAFAQSNGDQFESAWYCENVTDYAMFCDFVIGVSSLTYTPSTGAILTSATTEPVWGFYINITQCQDEGGGVCHMPFQPAVWAYVDTTVQPGGTSGYATSTSGEVQLALPTSGTLQATQAGNYTESSTHAATFDPPNNEPYGTTQATVPVPPSVTSISPTQAGAGNPAVTITLSGKLFGSSPTISVQGIGSNVGSGSDTSTSATISALNAQVGTYPVTVTVNGQTSNAVNLSLVCAVPTSFSMVAPACLPTGELDLSYMWSSSTGNTADISACWVGEYVTYNGTPPSPPFPANSGYVNPTINPPQGTSNGTWLGILDRNEPPIGSFKTPYTNATFAGSQNWGYNCPCQAAGSGTVIATSFPSYSGIGIVRQVTQLYPPAWYYTILNQGNFCSLLLP